MPAMKGVRSAMRRPRVALAPEREAALTPSGRREAGRIGVTIGEVKAFVSVMNAIADSTSASLPLEVAAPTIFRWWHKQVLESAEATIFSFFFQERVAPTTLDFCAKVEILLARLNKTLTQVGLAGRLPALCGVGAKNRAAKHCFPRAR